MPRRLIRVRARAQRDTRITARDAAPTPRASASNQYPTPTRENTQSAECSEHPPRTTSRDTSS